VLAEWSSVRRVTDYGIEARVLAFLAALVEHLGELKLQVKEALSI
jgi:hypothetical protein